MKQRGSGARSPLTNFGDRIHGEEEEGSSQGMGEYVAKGLAQLSVGGVARTVGDLVAARPWPRARKCWGEIAIEAAWTERGGGASVRAWRRSWRVNFIGRGPSGVLGRGGALTGK